jgi:hypothetical protein
MKHLLKAHCHCLACPANSDRQHLIPKRCGTHTCPPAPPAGVGIPLTMPQLEAEGLPVVVSRLVGRRHYLLAVRICQALGLSTEQVGRVGLVAWSGRWYIGWEGWGLCVHASCGPLCCFHLPCLCARNPQLHCCSHAPMSLPACLCPGAGAVGLRQDQRCRLLPA